MLFLPFSSVYASTQPQKLLRNSTARNVKSDQEKGKVGEFSNQAKQLENEANKIPLACYLSFTKFQKKLKRRTEDKGPRNTKRD